MLAAAAASTLLGTSDFSIVAIAMPSLTAEFGASTSTVVWIALSYQLMVLGLALPMGRLGDQFGPKTIFASGAFIYAVALALAAAAPGILALIGLRAVQGVGSAMMFALSVGLVSTAFPANEKGKALGMLASVAGFGLMAGPALGGVLLDTLGWRSIFWARAPFGFAAFALAAAYLPNTRATADRRTDFTGAALLFAALALMAVGLNRGSSIGWTSPPIAIAALLSAGAMAAFALRSLRAASPVVDLRMFRDRTLSFSIGLMLVAGISQMAVTFLMPFYLLSARGLTPIEAGFVMLCLPIMFIFIPPFAGRLSDRIGVKTPTTIGLGLSATALFLFTSLSPATPTLAIVAMLLLAGMGGSFFHAPNQSAIMRAAPQERVGTVSALVPTVRSIGLIVGAALAEAVFTSGLGIAGLQGASAERVASAAQTAFLLFACVMAVTAAAALFRPASRN